jgi:hypothetical protein
MAPNFLARILRATTRQARASQQNPLRCSQNLCLCSRNHRANKDSLGSQDARAFHEAPTRGLDEPSPDGLRCTPLHAPTPLGCLVAVQSPATTAAKIAPQLARNAPARTPAPKSRSTVIASAISAIVASNTQNTKRVPMERVAQKKTTSPPGPFPAFAPAMQQEAPVVRPETAQRAARFLLSMAS